MQTSWKNQSNTRLAFCDALEAEAPTVCNPVAYAGRGSKGTPLAHFFPPFLWASKEMGRGVGRGAPQISTGAGNQDKTLLQNAGAVKENKMNLAF